MLSNESLIFPKKLLDTPGPSGFESAPAKVWREEASKFAKVRDGVADEGKPGGGPVFTRGSVISPVVFNLLRKTAETNDIPFAVHAAGRDTSTDADAIHVAREGIATALVSIPNRYMHSPNEMVSLDDLDRTATLLAATCRAVDGTTDFTAR